MEETSNSIQIMPDGYNQFDLNFKIIIVGDSGKIICIKDHSKNFKNLKMFLKILLIRLKIYSVI